MPALPLPTYRCQEKVHDYQEAAMDGNVANQYIYSGYNHDELCMLQDAQ